MDTESLHALNNMADFAPIWTYINMPDNAYDSAFIDSIDTSIFRSLPVRDALIITTMNEKLTLDDITRFLSNPVALSSTRMVHECLSEIIHNMHYVVNKPRVERTIDLMNTLRQKDTNPEFVACAFAVNAYLSWILGDTVQAQSYNQQALEHDEHYSLALITKKALSMNIHPAYLYR